MEAHLAVEGPLDARLTLERYARWGPDPTTRVATGILKRAVRVDGVARGYQVTWAPGPDVRRLTVSVAGRGGARTLDVALDEVRRLFGLGFDLPGFYRAARGDRVLSSLVARLPGLRPTLAAGPLEMLIGSVCAQQVNLAWAFTVKSRLIVRYGEPVRVGRDTVHAFPQPSALGRASVAELRQMQFTTRKAEYIIGLARLVDEGALDLDELAKRGSDEIIAALTAVRGFGRWTAEWFLARGLGRGDVCPAGDLGVRRAFSHYYGRGRGVSEKAVRRRAAAWGLHQTLAVHYLLAGERLDAERGR